MWRFGGVGLLLLLLAGPTWGQSRDAPWAPGDTVYTSTQTALWADSLVTVFRAALPPNTPLVVEAVGKRSVAVGAEQGQGWVRRSVLDRNAPRDQRVVRHRTPGASYTARPSWRFRRGGYGGYAFGGFAVGGHTAILDRLTLLRGTGGETTVFLGLSNLASARTVKEVFATTTTYEQAPDSSWRPVDRRTLRALGPIAPGMSASYHFAGPRARRSGVCVAVDRVSVVHLDGTVLRRRPARTRSGTGFSPRSRECPPDR